MSEPAAICSFCAEKLYTGQTHSCPQMRGGYITFRGPACRPLANPAPIVTDAMIEAGLEAIKQYTMSLSSDPESFKGGRYLTAIFLAMHAAMVNPPPQTADGSDAAPT